MTHPGTPTGDPPHRSELVDETKLHLAYAEASVLLIESLMLLLAERRILSVEEMVETMETAVATKHEFVKEGLHPEIAAVAAGVLSSIANSVRAAQSRRS